MPALKKIEKTYTSNVLNRSVKGNKPKPVLKPRAQPDISFFPKAMRAEPETTRMLPGHPLKASKYFDSNVNGTPQIFGSNMRTYRIEF